ncbi:enterobactin synthetase component E [includes: 2,3-dihydroxybenzoate-AMP ligase; S-dihydroxybenzoyltransferase] [Escherichia coli]|uniref:Enterobactin synthetase component E [includes: 2,3-dihydroxybenzoate-AMP ligase S-dihydroxybenzoyltransferase] n=1 Tax=Escherichia coli TaxID=562 RepID=A0A2X1P661_ECOLX|nr:enterobactin synthetase component E [includes: 2,3-dihydroxybenzoate-AMP ligase; S-dihydroxybenzoyltransferase] [Escherichia coli]
MPVAIGKRLLAGFAATDILTRHAASDSIAVIDGERQLSYRELNQAADNLACSLRRQGIKPGETALVQLGNVA